MAVLSSYLAAVLIRVVTVTELVGNIVVIFSVVLSEQNYLAY